MHSEIGKKIKNLSNIVMWSGIIASIVIGIAIFTFLYNSYMTDDFSFIGIIVGIVGSISSWLGSFVLYGFGELIEQVTQINNTLKNQKSGKKTASPKKEKPKPSISTEKLVFTNSDFQEMLKDVDFSDLTLEELDEMLEYKEITLEVYNQMKAEIISNSKCNQ